MATKTIKFNKPEIISSEPIDPILEQFLLNILGDLNIRPKAVFYNKKIASIEPNMFYVSCSFVQASVVDEGIVKNLTLNDLNYLNNSIVIPGDITISDRGNNIFAYYEELNSIAIVDIFANISQDLNSTNSARIERGRRAYFLAKMILAFSKKKYKNFEVKRQSEEEIQKELDSICIGADPEFSIIRKNDDTQFVNAQAITKTKDDFRIGADGHASILELRPNPSNNIHAFLKNVENIVIEASELVGDDEHEIISGGGKWADESLGGHIHFSGVQHTKDFIELCDVLIGRPLKNCAGGKRPQGGRQNYDLDGQIRIKSYGFEYRTPPSFYGNEKLAKSTYVVAYLLAKTVKRCQKLGEDFIYDDCLTKTNYTKLVDYEKFKEYVDYFYDHTAAKLPINGNVFNNWKISEKKAKDILTVEIIASEEKYIADIVPKEVKLWKPPFRQVRFYGIAHSNAPMNLINIDSLFINYNVNTGIVQKWLNDYFGQICIVDYYTSTDNVRSYVEHGQLNIGLSKTIRETLAKTEAGKREIIFKKFLQRLALFIRDAAENVNVETLEEDLEKAELQTINRLIN